MPLSANSSAVLNVSMNSLTSGQNASLRAGIEKETEGLTLVSTRHSALQFPLHPYRRGEKARKLVHRSDLMSLESERRVLFFRIP